MIELENLVEIRNKYGLHARASTRLAQVAQKFKADIRIAREDNNQEADAKSILGILTLGAERGMRVRLRVKGDDATEAMNAICQLIQANFHEE